MLDVASEREVEGDLCLHDLGHGLPLRPGSFDGAVSISAVQWLCNAVSQGNIDQSNAATGVPRPCVLHQNTSNFHVGLRRFCAASCSRSMLESAQLTQTEQ